MLATGIVAQKIIPIAKRELNHARQRAVTQREYTLADDVMMMSVTDPQSRICYANPGFIAVSGSTKAN
ncbi:hypothetical protein M3I53_25935 [Paraburkholderia sp. CNPSo 3272]|uniref:hypothetical protein n=1 Tax=Paraburkholderia sp. CNPSo 3272 TaxID=2940931 RepID=UPI0020B66418|nr:hypothetical protein [Paraburkholderia sp. CNPSo 3272]MCP3726529.1 hypothetical protein [Paraburkholderia sp. CNPSo 3272]